MNRTSRNLVCLLAAALLLLPVFSAHATAGQFAVVHDTTFLNVRTGPGEQYEIIGRVDRGGWVEILQRYDGWYLCKNMLSGGQGYMSATYLREAQGGGSGTAYIYNRDPAQHVNLRQAPSYDAQVLAAFYSGAPVTVLSESQGWYYVEANGLRGYIQGDYLRFDGGGQGQSATIYSANGGSVNVRSGPSYNYAVISQFRPGTSVTLLLKGAKFHQISVSGIIAFIDANFLRIGSQPPPAPGPGPAPVPGSGNASIRTSISSLNLRDLPSLSARVLGQYRGGTPLTVKRQGTLWCAVTINGKSGYMMTKFLSLRGFPDVPTMLVRQANSTYVNLRANPAMTARVLVRVPHNSVVTIISPGPQWTYIQYKSTKGYMLNDFLKSF